MRPDLVVEDAPAKDPPSVHDALVALALRVLAEIYLHPSDSLVEARDGFSSKTQSGRTWVGAIG